MSHPLVIPEWLNWPPAKVVMVPVAPPGGISIAGTLLMWQLSHAALVGTCAGLKPPMPLGVTP